jgi:hypothetical protein
MTINQSSSDEPGPEVSEKKSYEKPDFRFEEVFVTSALTCGKMPAGHGRCQGSPHAS